MKFAQTKPHIDAPLSFSLFLGRVNDLHTWQFPTDRPRQNQTKSRTLIGSKQGCCIVREVIEVDEFDKAELSYATPRLCSHDLLHGFHVYSCCFLKLSIFVQFCHKSIRAISLPVSLHFLSNFHDCIYRNLLIKEAMDLVCPFVFPNCVSPGSFSFLSVICFK